MNKDELNSLLLQHCIYGELNNIKYLLTEGLVDIHSSHDSALKAACIFRHLDVVKYLLTSTDVKEHADATEIFKNLCEANDTDIITQYLIFDFNIQVTNEINVILKDKPDIQRLLNLREMNGRLNIDLEDKTNRDIRNKKI
jgi:hypothetical protein